MKKNLLTEYVQAGFYEIRSYYQELSTNVSLDDAVTEFSDVDRRILLQ